MNNAISMNVLNLKKYLSSSEQTIQSFDSRCGYDQKYKKQYEVKQRRNERLRKLKFQQREHMKKKGKRNVERYQKGKLDHAYVCQ